LPAAELARAAAGGVLALLAVVLMLWALRAFPALSTGHYVLPEQQIVCSGPYRLVRHPLYLAAFAIWVALAISFASRFALAASLLYVVPAYLFYIRSEEQMLLGHFGDAYRTYQRRVGMLFPRWPRRASPSEGFPRCAG
jgi:protein-S-isoprenylcysteine O-methyltransferase Ste14